MCIELSIDCLSQIHGVIPLCTYYIKLNVHTLWNREALSPRREKKSLHIIKIDRMMNNLGK